MMFDVNTQKRVRITQDSFCYVDSINYQINLLYQDLHIHHSKRLFQI